MIVNGVDYRTIVVTVLTVTSAKNTVTVRKNALTIREVNNSMLAQRIFPQLRGKWANVSLDAFAKFSMPQSHHNFPNPLLDPVYCSKWVDHVHKIVGCDHSQGGYLEDRRHLWRGHYIPADAAIHYGIDYNVSAGIEVHALSDCTLIHLFNDYDKRGGWGGRLTFQQDDGKVYLYAHVAHWGLLTKVGKKYKAGDLVGFVGSAPGNGNWYPHLHLQCIDFEYTTLADVDGYGKLDDVLKLAYPDPNVVLNA